MTIYKIRNVISKDQEVLVADYYTGVIYFKGMFKDIPLEVVIHEIHTMWVGDGNWLEISVD